jgi:hypothetical protein
MHNLGSDKKIGRLEGWKIGQYSACHCSGYQGLPQVIEILHRIYSIPKKYEPGEKKVRKQLESVPANFLPIGQKT